MPTPKVYEYEPICTHSYDGLLCEPEAQCDHCDRVMHERSLEAAYDTREEFERETSPEFHEWLRSTPGTR